MSSPFADTLKLSRFKMFLISSFGTSMPKSALILEYFVLTTAGATDLSSMSKRSQAICPQPSASIRLRARLMAMPVVYASTPFSKRAEESLFCPRAREVRRMFARSNLALSKSTSAVVSAMPLFRPPITPASATGFTPSQMTRLFAVSSNSFSSRVTIFSPSFARRTQISFFSTLERSKACMGCPSSNSTKLVMSTTLLMARSPDSARRLRSQRGDFSIFSPRT